MIIDFTRPSVFVGLVSVFTFEGGVTTSVPSGGHYGEEGRKKKKRRSAEEDIPDFFLYQQPPTENPTRSAAPVTEAHPAEMPRLAPIEEIQAAPWDRAIDERILNLQREFLIMQASAQMLAMHQNAVMRYREMVAAAKLAAERSDEEAIILLLSQSDL